MTPQQHAQVKNLFLKARELGPSDRDEYLRRECSDDVVVYDEVNSLMRYDTTDTVLLQNPMTTIIDASPRVGRRNRRVLSRIERAALRILHGLFASRRRRLLVVTSVLLGLLALAYWTYAGMKRSTESIAAAELTTILNADVKALELWIEEKKKDVRLVSSRPDIRRGVQELVRIAETEDDPVTALRSSVALVELHEKLEQYDRIVGRPEQDGVINREGMLLATANDQMLGIQMNDKGIAVLLPAFRGETLFLRPSPNGAFSDEEFTDLDAPVVHVVAPIRDDANENEIIAAVAFGFPADGEFSKILSVARQGKSGETFAFDANGMLLNESRFDHKLKESGLLPNAAGVRSILRIEVRDPGNPPYQNRTSSVQKAAQPLTELAAIAIAAGRKGSRTEQQGVVLNPYRSYRGATVIGAWRWLPKYGMGVATEVEVVEQYAPMRYPVIADRIRFGMLAVSVISLIAAASWIVILDRDLEQSKQLGQYVLEKEIGRGGMGVVYRASHALMKRPTAIKLLRPETVTDVSLARFEREVQLASGLTHPNSIEIFDFGKTPDGSFYCVMELLNGDTLEEIVRMEGPLPAQRVTHVLEQIAGSLCEAHGQGIVHRDIKPSNIMLCEMGGVHDVVKVLDFGLARTVKGSGEREITQPGLVVGTPPYLAPESITDPIRIDPRSDLYSFGAVAYFLLTGRGVFEALSIGDLIHKTVNDSPCQPSELTSNEIPGDLVELVMACLAKRPEERPQGFQEVLSRIAGVNKNLDQTTSEAGIGAKLHEGV